MNPDTPIVVAEVGCNHKGSMEVAREMIKVLASFCKVDYVKFQKRNPKELLSAEQYSAPHPNPQHSYGKTYGEHREFLELNIDQHKQLKDWCEAEGLKYGCSVWDLSSAKELVMLKPPYLKIPSACNLNFPLLAWLCGEYEGDIHISLGMTTPEEEQKLVEFLELRGRLKDVILYSCTSGYPVAFDDICLKEVDRLCQAYQGKIKSVGFSGHHLGIAADVAALSLGARWFERHFTLDRTWKGTDHAASLEPDGMRKLKRDLVNVAKALRYKESPLLNVEIEQRKKLKQIHELTH